MALLHRLRRDETITGTTAGETVSAPLPPPAALTSTTGPATGQYDRAAVRVPVAAGRTGVVATPPRPARALPPSVAAVAARTRLSAELLAAILEVDARQRATLDDIERADALAERLLARRADRQRATAAGRPVPSPAGATRPRRPRLAADVRLAS